MSSEPHLSVEIQHVIGTVALDASFCARAPWTVIFGPSGSGKSTLLRAIAGLLRPHHGTIRIRGELVCHTAEKVFLAPRWRPVRWSAQQPTLFANMTVAENIAFALDQSASGSAERRRATLADCLTHFRLQPLAARRPQQLSGGEQQRVALARAAIGVRGKLLLLDEPFTGLDVAVRGRLIADLQTWLGRTPVLSVTHSVEEALLLDAEVIRLEDGRVVAHGPATSVLSPEIKRLKSLLRPPAVLSQHITQE